MMRAIGLALALLLAACTAPQAKPPEERKPVAQEVAPISKPVVKYEHDARLDRDPAACKAMNGVIQPVCLMGHPQCVVEFSDGGKTCSDSSDCQGRCVADSSAQMMQPAKGTCAKTSYPCGCFSLVVNGVAQPTLCID